MGSRFQRRWLSGFGADDIRNHGLSEFNIRTTKPADVCPFFVCRRADITAAYEQRRHIRIFDWPPEHVLFRIDRRSVLRASCFKRTACVAVRGPSVIRSLFEWPRHSVDVCWFLSSSGLPNGNVSRHERLRKLSTGPLLLSVLEHFQNYPWVFSRRVHQGNDGYFRCLLLHRNHENGLPQSVDKVAATHRRAVRIFVPHELQRSCCF